MKDPNFLIIGAQKAGTTWLAEILNQHPDVFIPIQKEIHFFNKSYNYKKGISWYKEQFLQWDREKAIGEATPNYLWTTTDKREIEENQRTLDVPKLIYAHYPHVKLIVSLRDPAMRAVSAYYHLIRDKMISPSSRILEVAHKYGIMTMGFYQAHLQRWLNLFPASQFLILIFEEDILKNRGKTILSVCRFLDIDVNFIPDLEKVKTNPTLGPIYRNILYYFPWSRKIVQRLFPDLNRRQLPFRSLSSKQNVSKTEIIKLNKIYSEANSQLQSILGRSLPWPCCSDKIIKSAL